MAAMVSATLATLALVFPNQATAGTVQANVLKQARQEVKINRELNRLKKAASDQARHNAGVAAKKARERVAELAHQREAKKAAAEKARADKRAAARSETNSQASVPAARGGSLDGWIRQALQVMRAHGIPGSYQGIRRNVMRESTGNPRALNDWDINARRGTPSKGLLQVIDPTFHAYHVAGTSWNIYDPVANIAAGCAYAAANYGSIDNVHGAY